MSLIGTGDLRVWLKGIASGDVTPNPSLEAAANAIQDFCDAYTNRKLEGQRYHTDPQYCYLDGNGRPFIYVPQFPLSHVNQVCIDQDREFGSGTVISTADIYFYPSGKVVSEAGYFNSGRRNVRIDYNAGYAPVVGGTHNNAVSTYPIPLDLKQTMIEMAVQLFKEGLTAVHTIATLEGDKMIRMMTGNSVWKMTLEKYKNYSSPYEFKWE